MRTVAALTYDGVANFELAVLEEVFGFQRPELGDLYRFIVCAPAGPVRTSAGFTIDRPHSLRQLTKADTVIVPSWEPEHEPPSEVITALQSAYKRGARIMSVCTGAFLLAAAGIADDAPLTTHWEDLADLRAAFPRRTVVDGVRWVEHGHVVSSAGIAAGIDMRLHLVERLAGRALADRTARQMDVRWLDTP